MNKITCNGRVFSIHENKNGSKTVTLIVTGDMLVYPRFVFSDLPDWVEVNKHVTIDAHVRAYTLYEENGSRSVHQYFIGDDIKPEDTILQKATGYDGYYFDKGQFQASFVGSIVGISESNGWLKYTIEAQNAEGKNDYIRVSANSKGTTKGVQKGDNVACVCVLSTPKKSINGETRYFEDLVVSDVSTFMNVA